MGLIYAGNIVTPANTLIVKHGRGYSVGLWKDGSNRYGYFKIPPEHELAIEYMNAVCKKMTIGNCAKVFGTIHTANVGNSLRCDGTILKANAKNRAYVRKTVVRTRDMELEAKYQEHLNTIKAISDGLSEAEIQSMVNRAKEVKIRHKALIKLQGEFNSIVIQEPSGIPVIIEIHGELGTLDIGNCLECNGNIAEANVKNCIYATEIKQIINR